MIIRDNCPIDKISWISIPYGSGVINHLYEPESVNELIELYRDFNNKGLMFELIAHSSNTLFAPDYSCENVISTRKLSHFDILENCIICLCGTPVRSLSIAAIESGIKGFEGLIDLPGTVGAALYGNAGCYGCLVSDLLVEADVLTSEGEILTVQPEWFKFEKRSSALKRGEKKAVILSVKLKRDDGNREELKKKADINHSIRRATQPEAKNSLGSIFINSGRRTLLNVGITFITFLYGKILHLFGGEEVQRKRKNLTFLILNARDIEPYVRNWNWYQWKDERAHELFGKFVRLHRLMFTKSDFEIEVKRNKK